MHVKLLYISESQDFPVPHHFHVLRKKYRGKAVLRTKMSFFEEIMQPIVIVGQCTYRYGVRAWL